jgi:hypothetical protein
MFGEQLDSGLELLKFLVDEGVFDVGAVILGIGETLGCLFVEPVVGGVHQ